TGWHSRHFDGEARAGRLIVFHTNAGAVLGENVADNGEAQPGAAHLGGEIREKELFLLIGGDAAARIGNHDFDGIGIAGLRLNQQLFHRRILHGFRGIVDKVHDHALELFGIGHDGRKSGSEIDGDVDPFEPPVEDSDAGGHYFVEIAEHKLCGGEAGELRELVNQPLNGRGLIENGAGAFAQHAVQGFGQRRAIRLADNAFGAERDGGERITDFVRDTPRHLAPRRDFLSAQQIARVFDHDNKAGIAAAGLSSAFNGRDGDSEMERTRGCIDLELARGDAGAAGAIHQVAYFGGVLSREEIIEPRDAFTGAGKHLSENVVDSQNHAGGIHGDDSGGNALENGFGEPPARFQLGAVGFEIRRHAVEAVHQDGEFVNAGGAHAIGKIAAADFADTLYELRNGRADLARKILREPGGDEQDEQRDERQHLQEIGADAFSLPAQQVVLVDVVENVLLARDEVERNRHRNQDGADLTGITLHLRHGGAGGGEGHLTEAGERCHGTDRQNAYSHQSVIAGDRGQPFRGWGGAGEWAAAQQRLCLRRLRDQLCFGKRAAAHFGPERIADLHEVILDVGCGQSEPGGQGITEHVIAEKTHAEYRQDAQAESAGKQQGPDLGAGAAGLTGDPQLDHKPDKHKAQAHHQDEDQDGETEKYEGLGGVFRARPGAAVEGAEPEHDRRRSDQQNGGQSDGNALQHGMSSVYAKCGLQKGTARTEVRAVWFLLTGLLRT